MRAASHKHSLANVMQLSEETTCKPVSAAHKQPQPAERTQGKKKKKKEDRLESSPEETDGPVKCSDAGLLVAPPRYAAPGLGDK